MNSIKVYIFFFLATLTVMASNAQASRVLFFGDSHSVGPFGKKLDQLLRQNGNFKVRTFASCGAIARWFVTGQRTHCGYYNVEEDGTISKGKKGPTKKIEPVVENWKPEYVIVELSGNYNGYSDQFSIGDMKRMANYLVESGAKCLWVGAADSRDRSRIPRLYRLVEDAVWDKCRIVDSTQYTNYPTTGGDGVHYYGPEGTREARKWASAVYDEFLDFLDQEH